MSHLVCKKCGFTEPVPMVSSWSVTDTDPFCPNCHNARLIEFDWKPVYSRPNTWKITVLNLLILFGLIVGRLMVPTAIDTSVTSLYKDFASKL